MDTFYLRMIEAYGTPTFVYSLDELRRSRRRLIDGLPEGIRVHYSLKANPHPDIVGALVSEGCRADVSSSGELNAALDSCAASDILYTGPGKTDAEIIYALSRGVERFSVESQNELTRLRLLAEQVDARAGYLVRVNSAQRGSVGLRMTGKPSQFGVPEDEMSEELFRTTSALRFLGLHFFPASNVSDEANLIRSFAASISTASAVCDRFGLDITELHLGGGFGAWFGSVGELPRYIELKQAMGDLLDEGFPGWRTGAPAVAVESGRALVAAMGVLLCSVTDVKSSYGRQYAVTDSGVNHLGGFGALGRMIRSPLAPRLVEVGPARSDQSAQRTTVVGPLCTPADILVPDFQGPELYRGDVLAIPSVGAYGLTASLIGFLGHPAPVEILHDGGTIVSASRITLGRQTAKPRAGTMASSTEREE